MTGERSFFGVPFRLCLLLAACLVGTTLISRSGAARASELGVVGKSIQIDIHADAARKAATIAFYTNLAGPVGTGNPLLARPNRC
jgi:hypothetical protein